MKQKRDNDCISMAMRKRFLRSDNENLVNDLHVENYGEVVCKKATFYLFG
jgi:hypothetical protein